MSFPCRIHRNVSPCYPLRRGGSLRRIVTYTDATPAYLLTPEVRTLLFCMPNQRQHNTVYHPLEYRKTHYRLISLALTAFTGYVRLFSAEREGGALTNSIDPEAYLRHILSVLPEWPSNRVDELLP